MTVKIILSIMIVSLSFFAGYVYSLKYENRIRHLNELMHAFKTLEAEMNFSREILWNIFQKISDNNENLTGQMFQSLHDELYENKGRAFREIWHDAAEKTFGRTSLTREDMNVIIEFGLSLGKTDTQNQNKLFEHLFDRMNTQLAEAISKKEKEGRMYKSIGTACGIAIVVIII